MISFENQKLFEYGIKWRILWCVDIREFHSWGMKKSQIAI